MEREEFSELVEAHKDAVYRQLIRVCGQREDAEDALATALLLALQHLDQLDQPEAFRAWLGTIGRRVCTRMRRHAGMETVLEQIENLGLAGGAEMEMQVLKSCVKSALETLTPEYRSVYEACEIEERPLQEVADELGITLAATKSRLHRARALVREELDGSICGS